MVVMPASETGTKVFPRSHSHGHVWPWANEREPVGSGRPTAAQSWQVLRPESVGHVAVVSWHGEHLSDVLRPVDAENVPAGQPWHLVAPPPKKPTLHAEHAPEHRGQRTPVTVVHCGVDMANASTHPMHIDDPA